MATFTVTVVPFFAVVAVDRDFTVVVPPPDAATAVDDVDASCPDASVVLENGTTEAEILVLQGRPIGEPVVQSGPFVMNTRAEIKQAYEDYRATRFGGWPWQSDDPVHGQEPARFARHADGRTEHARD